MIMNFFCSNSPQEKIELGGKVAYHVKDVPVKDNKNKHIRQASLSANSPRYANNWLMCSYVLFP
jgi:hypothetical protein